MEKKITPSVSANSSANSSEAPRQTSFQRMLLTEKDPRSALVKLFNRFARGIDEFMEVSGQGRVLRSHVDEILRNITYSYVCEIGAGTGAMPYLRPDLTEILAIDPSADSLDVLTEKIEKKTLELGDTKLTLINDFIENVNLEKYQFDLVVLTFTFDYLQKKYETLEKICGNKPRHVLISNQHFEEGKEVTLGKTLPAEDRAVLLEAYKPITQEEQDEIMEAYGYVPVVKLCNPLRAGDGTEAGKLESTLYELKRDEKRPNDDIYAKAKLIAQINNGCMKNCPGCYESGKKNGRVLNPDIFTAQISKLAPGDLIVIRGGEPTLHPRWFEDFVQPALDKGLEVVINTNGHFINRPNYQETLKKLSNKKITVQLSFDEDHLAGLGEKERKEEFAIMAQFAKDATERGINFGIYALGMGDSRIDELVAGTPLQEFREKFQPLTFYGTIVGPGDDGKDIQFDGLNVKDDADLRLKGDMTNCPLKGVYLNVDGIEEKTILS